MNEQEIMDRLWDALMAAIKQAKAEKAKLLKASEPDILVPEGIIGIHSCGRLGIINKYQILSGSSSNAPWVVRSIQAGRQNYKLVKCDRKDLKYGDIAFRCDADEFKRPNSNNWYSLILNSTEHVEWSGRNVVVLTTHWNDWYKVTPIGDK